MAKGWLPMSEPNSTWLAIGRFIVGLVLFVVGVTDLVVNLHTGTGLSVLDGVLITAGAGVLGVHVGLGGTGGSSG